LNRTVVSSAFERLQDAHLRDGVVRNLPAAFAGSAFHPPVAPARAVPNLPDGPEESRIARVTVLALARVVEGRRVTGVEPNTTVERDGRGRLRSRREVTAWAKEWRAEKPWH
jgi:hypothetical protein